ncbi:MAG: hypothetical protein NVV74_17320 [Magnetospirillum sp.]|nr:hypothetical protein [Magnetospirillum sp.]
MPELFFPSCPDLIRASMDRRVVKFTAGLAFGQTRWPGDDGKSGERTEST